jgi:hypothetical protein
MKSRVLKEKMLMKYRFLVSKLIASFLVISSVTNLNGQTNILSGDYLTRDIDSIGIFKMILPDGIPFYYSKAQAEYDFNKCNTFPFDFPFSFWAKKNGIIGNTLNNIYFESDSVLIDSNYVHKLINQYRQFNISSNRFGEPQYFRPDLSIKTVIIELKQQANLTSKLYEIISPISRDLYDFRFWGLENRDKKGDIKPSNRLDTLIPRLNSIAQEVNSKILFAKDSLKNEFLINTLIKIDTLIKNFKRQYAPPKYIKVTETMLNYAGDIWAVANGYMNWIHDENYSIGNHIEILQHNAGSLGDKKYSLLRLLSVDPNINYDTSFIIDRHIALTSWAKEMSLDSVLSLLPLQISKEGKFEIRFVHHRLDDWEKERSFINLAITNFLKKIFKDTSSSQQEQFNDFTSYIWVTASSIFHLPNQQTEIIIYNLRNETEIITYDKGNIKSIIPPCSNCEARTQIILHKDESLYVSSTFKSATKGIGQIEDVIYRALVRYFNDKKCTPDSWKRVTVANGQVTVWLNNARQLVLENENYWENVKYDFKILRKADDLQIALVTYGEYGTGIVFKSIGKPPSYSAYKPMEPKFSKPLQVYCSDVLYKIKDILTQ